MIANSPSGSAECAPRSAVAFIADRYRFPPNLTGKGECIGILAFGGEICRSDLTRFFEHETGSVPDLRFEYLSPARRRNGNSQHDAEIALDIQLAGALAPGACIITYFSTIDEPGWVKAVSRAIEDERNRPSISSISWGATEDCWGLKTMRILSELFKHAARRGITICAASGDDGCATDANGHSRVTFPASSPHVLACGGTTLAPDDTEAVWNVRGFAASGGGISDRIPRPKWQPHASGTLPSPFPSRRNPSFDGRQLPDVSGLASDLHSVYVGGAYRRFRGGTSAVAPLWSALIARLNEGLRQRKLPRVGYFHPRLYQDRSIQESFRAIVAGHNDPMGASGYHARAGWNFCTGWGSPDGVRLLDVLSALKVSDRAGVYC